MIFYVTFGPAHLPNPALPGVIYGDVLVVDTRHGRPHGQVRRLLGEQYHGWSDLLTEAQRAACGTRWDDWFPGTEHPIEKFETPATVTWRRERRVA